jgi:hypothetical protein
MDLTTKLYFGGAGEDERRGVEDVDVDVDVACARRGAKRSVFRRAGETAPPLVREYLAYK